MNSNEASTVANTIAIAELTQIVKSVATDTDKLVTHIDSLIVCKEKMSHVEEKLEEHTALFKDLGLYFMAIKYPKIVWHCGSEQRQPAQGTDPAGSPFYRIRLAMDRLR